MRDIVLGVNDGLVSTFLLVVGVVGGGLTTNQVRLTAIAGAVAGAISMATGEWLATRSQEDVFDREIALERTHIRDHRQMEVDQLYEMFTDIGIPDAELETVVQAFSHNDETLLNAMKVLEFGIIETERRSPFAAMMASGLLFIAGAMTSVVPFFFVTTASSGLIAAGVLTAIGLFAVGVAKTSVTGTNPWTSGIQNLMITTGGGVAAFLIGRLVQTSLA